MLSFCIGYQDELGGRTAQGVFYGHMRKEKKTRDCGSLLVSPSLSPRNGWRPSQ